MIKLIEEIRNICSRNVNVDWLENDASEEFAQIIKLIDGQKANISLSQGWELTPRIGEAGELTLSVSNQQGKVLISGDEDWEQEEYIESYRVSNNKQNS